MDIFHHQHSLVSTIPSTLSEKPAVPSLLSVLLHQTSSLKNYADDDRIQLEKLVSDPNGYQTEPVMPISPIGVNVVTDAGHSASTIGHSSATHYSHCSILAHSGHALHPVFSPTPRHNLVFQGGKTIADLNYVNLYLGGQSAWKHSDIQSIDASLAAAMSDPRLNSILSQYFPDQPATSQFLGSAVLPGAAPTIVSEATIKNLLAILDQAGALQGFDLSKTAFNFLLPSGTVLTDGEDNSLEGLGGYHGSVHVKANGQTDTIYYAVGVYPQQYSHDIANGIPVFNQPWQNAAAEFYHELNEIRTDPDVEDAIKTGNGKLLGWIAPQGDEIGDFPVREAAEIGALRLVFQRVPLADGNGAVPIQLLYSDAVSGIQNPSVHQEHQSA